MRGRSSKRRSSPPNVRTGISSWSSCTTAWAVSITYYDGLALSFQQTGQYARALSYAQKGLRIFETLRDVRMTGQLRLNMGDMLLQQGRVAEAERLFSNGAEHLQRIGDRELVPHLVAGMAESALEASH